MTSSDHLRCPLKQRLDRTHPCFLALESNRLLPTRSESARPGVCLASGPFFPSGMPEEPPVYAKELWIVVVEGGPGGSEITTESARGLFTKYAKESRTETQLVVWNRIASDGQVEEVNRWKRNEKGGGVKEEVKVSEKEEVKDKKKENIATNPQPVASGTLVDIGLYVIAHGNDNSQIAGAGVYGLIKKLQAAKIPRASKVSFVSCYSGKQDEGAINDTRRRDYDPTKHGLDVDELSFVSMFALGYQEEYAVGNKPLYVAGWESFVSVYHPNKTSDVPDGAGLNDAGRKYVSGHTGDSYTFMKPKSTSRTNKKRMFKWSFVDGKPKVERIDLTAYKRST